MTRTADAGAKPVRVRLSRAKGWRMPPNTVKVDRTTKWGNFYCVGEPLDMKVARRWEFEKRDLHDPERVCANAEDAVRRFAAVIGLSGWIPPMIRRELRGKNLACWCDLSAPWCHADVLLEIANAPPERDPHG